MGDASIEELSPYLDQLSREELEELFASVAGYDTQPVGIDEFLDSDRFLGTYFEGGVFPYWRGVLHQVYPSPFYSPYWLVTLRGAIGQGKTSIACAGMLYDLYRLQCLSKPQQTFGLIPSTKILFAIFNVTMALTHDVVWDKVSQMLAASTYFSPWLASHAARKRRGESMFDKNLDFFFGSRIGHTLGKAVFEAIIDEANFEIMAGQVYETFNSLLRRMESRFTQPGATLPGKIWIVSSETDKFSTVNKVVDSYRSKNGVYVSQASLWDVQPQRYGTGRFWVYKGSDARQPEVLGATDVQHALLLKEPENCMQVPHEHKDAFDADINSALRDLGGVATTANFKLFRQRDRLKKATSISLLFPEVVTLDFDDDTDQLINRVVSSGYFANPLSGHVPRHIHIDIALSGDRLGIGASYISNFKERKSRDMNTFDEIVESVPEIVTEWAFGVEPTPGKQIPLYKIRLFVMQIQKMGYPIGGVTCDGYQSADMLQLFQKQGIEAELLSVDKTTIPYMSMRSAIYEGRHFLPNSKLLSRELEDLEVSSDAKKVDHPEKSTMGGKGSKDVADGVCGSYYAAELNSAKAKLFIMTEYANQSAHHAGHTPVSSMFWPGAQR